MSAAISPSGLALGVERGLPWGVNGLKDVIPRMRLRRAESRQTQRGPYSRGMSPRVLVTTLGQVEVAISGPAGKPVVLFFPGGHSTAATPQGTDLYTALGYAVLAFSRPGYGRTRVGALTAAEFAPAVLEVCQQLGITSAAATVGVSFGGLQAAHIALSLPRLAPRLVLHSCAPSTLPYPDRAMDRLVVPLVFGPRAQRLTWKAVRALTASDRGLRLMMASLSTLPTARWWDSWTAADRSAARETFAAMDSGSGFLNDVRQARADGSADRESSLRSIPCPALVTASHNDGGVSFRHAEDFIRTIPNARLVDTDAKSHFFWLGAERHVVLRAVQSFMGSGTGTGGSPG